MPRQMAKINFPNDGSTEGSGRSGHLEILLAFAFALGDAFEPGGRSIFVGRQLSHTRHGGGLRGKSAGLDRHQLQKPNRKIPRWPEILNASLVQETTSGSSLRASAELAPVKPNHIVQCGSNETEVPRRTFRRCRQTRRIAKSVQSRHYMGMN
jgi:hypothetical protein